MRNFFIFIIACLIGIANADGAVRDSDAVSRGGKSATDTNTIIARTTTVVPTTRTSERALGSRDTTSPGGRGTNIVSRGDNISRGANRTATDTTVARSARTTTTPQTTTSGRSATKTVSRTSNMSRASATNTVARSARATSVAPVSVTNTFGTDYNTCRNAYFTCMDQFCATANDQYRRCVCSSRLTDIQERERALSQTAGQIQDFKDLNIEVIPKTAEEVHAMLNATEGELAIIEDQSASAQQLAGISEVLSSAKHQALNTLGTLDIAGDINQIWATTDLASGANISNLTGESLYNAVHAQCVELISAQCPSSATLNMVVSAYGMYIENDCTTLYNALDTQLNQANSTIRETEREMNTARLDNYNAHNSTSINDCIAQVRADITADTACGTDYVHCLDVTGQYLNRDTGEPIYTPNFYQLANQVSLEGDVLTNPTNRMIVAELNSKRIYAERGLETCRDIANDVWDEFLRQAIAEIYQGQQEKIRTVKNECLDVVNACYDEQSESLKDFSNIKEELLAGSRLELSEELCEEKLYACSNLYGDPNGEGLELLITAMHDITDQKIAKECKALLEAFAVDTCSTPSNDSLHAYPYACRVYAPGEQKYATNWFCNQLQWENTSGGAGSGIIPGGGGGGGSSTNGYVCPESIMYTSCRAGYFMAIYDSNRGGYAYNDTPTAGNSCQPCPAGSKCPGGTKAPEGGDFSPTDTNCGPDYAGSLYQRMVKYATQVCVRPSYYDAIMTGEMDIPMTVLQDVNVVMDSIRVDMAKALSAECDRLGGQWVDTQWLDVMENTDTNGNGTLDNISDNVHDKTDHVLFKYFYDETGANTKWGFCAEIPTDEEEATEEEEEEENSGESEGENSGEESGGETT